jgi:cyclase
MIIRRAIGVRMATPVALIALVASAASAFAQQPAAPLTSRQLKPNVWEIEGGGGNTTVVVGSNGVIVVDAKTTADQGKQLVDEVKKITPKPITTVFLTHSDGDHVNGLAGFPAGVKVIAHENNKKEQEAALAAGGRGAPPADRLPAQVTTRTRENMTIEGIRVEAYHWAPAHTSGDLVIFFPDQHVVATGDIIAANRADDNPNIHLEKNGSPGGWITNVTELVKLDADTFVPGHGPLQTKADIQAKLKTVREKHAKIEAMVKQGKTLEEIKAAIPDSPAPSVPGAAPAAAPAGGRGGAPPAGYTDWTYQELTKKK